MPQNAFQGVSAAASNSVTHLTINKKWNTTIKWFGMHWIQYS